MQRELNETQSILQDQLRLIGNSAFKEGSIISGMALTFQGTDTSGDTGSGNNDPSINPNLISLSTITSHNSKINTVDYKNDGTVSVDTTATTSGDFPGIQFASVGSANAEFTLSFTIKRDSGTLYKFAGLYDNSLTVKKFLVDGQTMKTAFGDQTSTLLVDQLGNQINLNDGNVHNVQVTFQNANTGSYSITVIANPGYNAIKEGNVDFTISALKSEVGDTPTAWKLADGDKDINTGDQRNQKVQIGDGYVYLGGMIRKFDEQTINITGVGDETIGVSNADAIVTATDDTSLVDNTPGAASQWKQGADRLTYNVTLTYDDPNSATIYNIKDGKINNSSSDDSESKRLNDILAKRTNDESGSYRVTGFNLWSEKNTQDSSVINLVIDKGTAYVLGYQIIKGVSTRIAIPKATGTANMADEVLVVKSGQNYTGQLANQPVKQVNQVSGNVAVNGEAVTRGANLATNDTLKQQAYEIAKVYSLKSGNTTTTTSTTTNGTASTTSTTTHDPNEVDYIEGTDFKLVNGNQIQWITGGNAPTTGTTYYVDYDYENVFKQDVDYKINVTNSGALAVTTISFNGMGGLQPEDSSQLHINYDYFLARVDTVTLDAKGEFHVVSGKEDRLAQIKPISYIDPNTLILGYVTVYPNSDTATTQSQSVTRIPFSGLQDLVSRVQNLENTAQGQNIQNQSTAKQDPTIINGFFGDPFKNTAMSDIGNKEFTARMNLNAGQITIDDDASTELSLKEDSANSSVHHFDDMYTPDFTEKAYISQSNATGVININPFDSYTNVADITIDPSTDSWIDEKKTTVNDSKQGADTGSGSSQTKVEDGTTTNTTTTDTAIEYMRQRTINFTATNLMPLTDNLAITVDGVEADITPADNYSVGATKGTIKSDGDGNAKGSFTIPENIRCGSREVALKNPTNVASTVYTSNGINRLYTTTNTDNWHYNDYDEPVYYAPSYYTPDDSYSYTPPAPSGHYESTEWVLGSDNKYYANGDTSGNSGYATPRYFEDGQVQKDYAGWDIQWAAGGSVYTATQWVTDPVAQSFSVDKDGVISSFNLYFAGVPSGDSLTKSEVRVEVRNMDSGFPGTTCLTYGVLSPSDIKSSKDGSVATKVTLKNPLYVNKGDSYAIAAITSSDAYSLYEATIGENDLVSGNPVSSPAYIGGAFFESRNAETWSTDLNTSLKFDVLMDNFNAVGTETFQPITIDGNYFTDYRGNPLKDISGNSIPLILSRIVMLLKFMTPNNTSINAEFRYVLDKQPTNIDISSLDWQPFYVNTDVIFREKIRTIQFRINLNSTKDGSMAPEIVSGASNLIAYKVGTTGTYLMDNLSTSSAPYNHLRISYKATMPQNSSIVTQYSIDGGSTWSTFDKGLMKTTAINSNVNQYAYDLQLYDPTKGDTETANQIKVRIAMVKPDNFGDLYVMALSGSLSLQDGNESGNNGWSPVPVYDTIIPGIILWHNDGSVQNPTTTLAHKVSELRNGLLIHFTDKSGNVYTTTVDAKSLVTNTAYNLNVHAKAVTDDDSSDNTTSTTDNNGATLTKTDDNTLVFANLDSLYPFEIDAN